MIIYYDYFYLKLNLMTSHSFQFQTYQKDENTNTPMTQYKAPKNNWGRLG